MSHLQRCVHVPNALSLFVFPGATASKQTNWHWESRTAWMLRLHLLQCPPKKSATSADTCHGFLVQHGHLLMAPMHPLEMSDAPDNASWPEDNSVSLVLVSGSSSLNAWQHAQIPRFCSVKSCKMLCEAVLTQRVSRRSCCCEMHPFDENVTQ